MRTNMEEAILGTRWGIASVWVKESFASSCHLFPCIWCLVKSLHLWMDFVFDETQTQFEVNAKYNSEVSGITFVHDMFVWPRAQWAVFCLWAWECNYVCLKCAAAKTDRTQAHIRLPRKRYKATLTHTHTQASSLPSHTHPLSFQLCIFELFSVSNCLHTHIHMHTCSPHPAKRERWLVNKQWHSARSVTRLSFDQHCCSCSPQQCFLSFCPPNAAMHTLTNTHTHLGICVSVSFSYMGLQILAFSYFFQ